MKTVKPDGISFKDYMSKVKATLKLNTKRLRSGLTILKSIDIDGYRIIIPKELNASATSLSDAKFRKLIGTYMCSLDRDDDTQVWLNLDKDETLKSSDLKW